MFGVSYWVRVGKRLRSVINLYIGISHVKGEGKVHAGTGTEALYRPYGQ